MRPSTSVSQACGSTPFSLALPIRVLTTSLPESGRYTIELRDSAGRLLSRGELVESNNGTLIYFEYSGKNLSRGTRVIVLDASGRPVLKGAVEPAAEA